MATDVDLRVQTLLAKANLAPPSRLDALQRPAPLRPAIHLETIEARECLESQRPTDRTPVTPASPARLWRSIRPIKPKRQEAQSSTWIITDHEVAAVTDALLDQNPLKSVGVAQTVLQHARPASLDQLWRSLHGGELHTGVPWLSRVIQRSTVTSPRELDYIQLLCETGPSPEVLDAAFCTAFDKGCAASMGLLLSYDADASRCQEGVRKRVQLGHLDMIKLLLAAPRSMSVDVWRHILHPCEHVDPAVLAHCLSRRRDVANEDMLRRALSAHNFSATAIVLAYASSDESLRWDQDSTCKMISRMDASKRYAFFDLINEAGFMYDNPTLREEVLRDVTDREMSLIRLLVEAGVCLDVGPLNALKMAVTQMDLEILDVLSHGTFDNVSAALDWVPPNATEQGILKVLENLRALCLEGDPLSRRLICAVRSKHVLEATELIRMGASIDYKQGLALQIAIHSSDPDMLDILLHGDCTPQVLSRVVPALMKVQPPKARLTLLEKILIKGTLPETLGGPLEVLLAESGEADLECIALLLRYGASPDASDEEATNSVLVAASHGWLHALKLLCEAPIRPMILAKAVLAGFRDFPMAAQDHDTLLTIMRLLLGKGAKGKLVDQTLLSAVTRESRLDVVQLLLSSGANANYKQGEAFVSALGSRNSRIFDALCKTCPPDLASSERIMPYAIGQRYYEPKSLNTFLQCTQHKRAALDVISAASLEKSSNIKTIMHCLLSHGLRVNGGECKFLHLAVLADDISLLKSMLAAKPNVLSLQLAFETALRVNKRRKRLDVMKFLLEHASATEIGQTMCIAHQTQLAIDGDLEGLRLILHHGASVDHQGGIAVQRAARSGLMDVLRLLLKYRPGVDTVTKACLACLESFEKRGDISPDHKNSIYEALLDSSAGINVDHLSSLLLASIQSVSSEVQFPMLLLRRGAKVYEKTTRLALETASDDLSRLIVRKSSGRELFHLVFACELTVERRTWLLDEWLKQDIRQVDKCRALLHSLDTKRIHDLPIVELLLKHGADVSFENGEALKLAVRAQSPDAIALLGKSVKTREVANNAFVYAAKAVFNDPSTRFKIYQGLLNGNLVDKANCYGALKNCLDRQGADLDTVRLLVTKGADPCAACFISTCRIGSTKHFRELCKSADLDRLVDALLSSFHDETDAARWLKLCLQQQHPSARITNPDLLIRCIKKYPNGEVLTGLVLARSNIAAQTVIYSVFPGWAEEKCSLLIWALLSRPRVSSKTILKLLAAGCDVDLKTPTTRVSASMACVLDNSRTPVLKALLKMRPDFALEPHVPASVLACLGAEPGSASKDPINEIGALTLCQASVYVGNIDSYELLASYSVPDEDDLHLAAWLALPKFVEKFLKDHDPELESEAYGNYTPLAVALETDSGQSYCKVADAEASFEDRRKRTIDLLAKKSNLAWRYRQKTYVHIAFAIGPGTTKILLDALDIKTASSRFSMLVYEDKAGRRYTPFEYINELMNLQPSERDELMRCLAGANLLTDAERITFAYR